MGRSRILGVVVVAIALALVASACSSTSDEETVEEALEAMADSSTSSTSSTTSTSSSTTTTTTTTVPVTEPEPDPTDFPEPSDGEVFDEYIARQVEGFGAAMRAAIMDPTSTPEVDHPDIAKYAAESFLDINHEVVRDFVRDGWVAREPEVSAVGRTADEKNRVSRVMEAEDDKVKVFRCRVEDEDILDSETDEVEIQGVVTILSVITLKQFDDGWKAVFGEITQKFEGVAGCFLANDIEFSY